MKNKYEIFSVYLKNKVKTANNTLPHCLYQKPKAVMKSKFCSKRGVRYEKTACSVDFRNPACFRFLCLSIETT